VGLNFKENPKIFYQFYLYHICDSLGFVVLLFKLFFGVNRDSMQIAVGDLHSGADFFLLQ